MPRYRWELWLRRLIAWDGVLPALIWMIPMTVAKLLPGWRGPLEVLVISLPVTGAIARFFIGKRMISRNGCGRATRCLQWVALCAGILMLVLVDLLMILRCVMPQGPVGGADPFVGLLFLIYLLFMAIAIFPGPSRDLSEPLRR